MGIGFEGSDFVDGYKVYVDPTPDPAAIAIDNSFGICGETARCRVL
jgi:hypothetical protein